MPVSVASSIAVITAALKVRLTFTATSGNSVRVWCSAAPAGSRLRSELDKSVASRAHVFDVDSGKGQEYAFDVPGVYSLIASEMRLGSGYGGSYQYDVDAAPSENLLSETPVSIFVANGLKTTLGIGGDTAELDLYVANANIQETSLNVHGVATPGIFRPKSAKAKTAAAAAGVQAAVASLGGLAAQFATGDLSFFCTDWIAKFNAHAGSTAFHAAGDSGANLIPAEYRNPTSPDGLKRTLAMMLRCLGSHIRNDSVASPQGTGSHPFHVISSSGVVDWAHIPLFESTSSIAEHLRGLADAIRCFEAHRVTAAPHLAIDTVNVVSALSPLLSVHSAFLTQLATVSPTPPVTDNAGKTALVHGAGFEEL